MHGVTSKRWVLSFPIIHQFFFEFLTYDIAFSITLVFSRAQLIPFPCFQPAPEDPRAGRDQPPHAHEDGAPPRPRANHYET